MAVFHIPGIGDTEEIRVSETVGELTGTIHYRLHSDHAHGDIAFFPSWYTSYDSSPHDFYVASSVHGATRGALDRGNQLRVHATKADFYYAGTRIAPEGGGAGYREVESHIWLPEPRLEHSVARQRVSETAQILRRLIDVSLQRPDIEDLRHMADLAAADMRSVFEQWRVNELHALISDYTQQRADADRRASAFISQAHIYRLLSEQHKKRQTHQQPNAPQATPPKANTPPTTPPRPGPKTRRQNR